MPAPLSRRRRYAVLAAAFAGLVFDGVELALMPIASASITKDLCGPSAGRVEVGTWFARYTAALMLGAAVGGVWLGRLGDRVGRARAMGVSILFYSAFAGLGAWAADPWHLLGLRFLVGLGVGGMWPNGVALVSECWPAVSKPVAAGVMGAGINVGVLILAQVTRVWPVTPDSWRWLFGWCAAPAVLGVLVLAFLPESPAWAARDTRRAGPGGGPLSRLFRPPLRRTTLLAVLLGAVPLVGAWAAGKWMIPWADEVGTAAGRPDYKSVAQGYWAVGATVGSFAGAQVAAGLGRRRSYLLISLGSAAVTCGLFVFAEPAADGFLTAVLLQGFVTTLFFGWLPLYLPGLFPTEVRATGSGLAFNAGRFATAAGVFAAGGLVALFDGDLAKVGAATGLIYALGVVAACLLRGDHGEAPGRPGSGPAT